MQLISYCSFQSEFRKTEFLHGYRHSLTQWNTLHLQKLLSLGFVNAQRHTLVLNYSIHCPVFLHSLSNVRQTLCQTIPLLSRFKHLKHGQRAQTSTMTSTLTDCKVLLRWRRSLSFNSVERWLHPPGSCCHCTDSESSLTKDYYCCLSAAGRNFIGTIFLPRTLARQSGKAPIESKAQMGRETSIEVTPDP